MKTSKLIASLLFAAAMTSCINDADVLNDPDITPPANKGDGNIKFSFVVPNSAIGSKSVEDSGIYEQGSADEYKVSNVRVYLFNSESQNIVKSFVVQFKPGDANTSNQTVTYASTDEFVVDPGTYDIYAVANRTTVNGPTVDALLAHIDTETYPDGTLSVSENGFVMTNRGAANQKVVIAKPAEKDEVVNVKIKLERVVAKLMVAKQKDDFVLKDPDGKTYATVELSNYRFFNLSTKFYSFRHIATLKDGNDDTYLKEPTFLPTNDFFGDIPGTNGYVIDPYFFMKTVKGAPDFTNPDGYFAQPFIENKTAKYEASLSKEYKSIYCLENCMYRPAQFHGYTTGVSFKAGLVIPSDHTFNEEGKNVEPTEQPKLFYFNYNFYTSLKAVHDVGLANVPEKEEDLTPEMQKKYGIKIFNKVDGDFACYYDYFIQHEPSDNPAGDVMEFGIVRNNIYRVLITEINGLGSGTPDVDPGVPDKYKALLKVDFEIYPWFVREQNGSLGD